MQSQTSLFLQLIAVFKVYHRVYWSRDGTGQEFLDPDKFQNLRQLTGRSTGF